MLIPQNYAESLDVKSLLDTHRSTEGFEIEGRHDGEYTIAGINTETGKYSTDTNYFMSLLVW